MAFARGDSFHYGATNSTRRLHIILCESTRPQEAVIAVSINTVTEWTDRKLILTTGDHPYIRRDSAVSFNRVDAFPLSVLIAAEAASKACAPGFRTFDHDVPVSPELLDRVTRGALSSPRTPKGMKREIRRRLGLP
jgi:hypothetical protein